VKRGRRGGETLFKGQRPKEEGGYFTNNAEGCEIPSQSCRLKKGKSSGGEKGISLTNTKEKGRGIWSKPEGFGDDGLAKGEKNCGNEEKGTEASILGKKTLIQEGREEEEDYILPSFQITSL